MTTWDLLRQRAGEIIGSGRPDSGGVRDSLAPLPDVESVTPSEHTVLTLFRVSWQGSFREPLRELSAPGFP